MIALLFKYHTTPLTNTDGITTQFWICAWLLTLFDKIYHFNVPQNNPSWPFSMQNINL